MLYLCLFSCILITIIYLLYNHGGHMENENQENDDNVQIEYLRKYNEEKMKKI